MCIRGTDVPSVSSISRLDFGTFATVRHFLFILVHMKRLLPVLETHDIPSTLVDSDQRQA